MTNFEKDLKKAKKQAKEEIMKQVELTDEEREMIEKAEKELNQPIELKDNDIKLGNGELDIRSLSQKSINQIMFRLQSGNLAYLRYLSQSLIDILRVVMLIATKVGVQNMTEEISELIDKLAKESKLN